MRSHLLQQPIRSFLIQSIERDRAFDAVEVGAGGSDVDRNAFGAQFLN
jgi:hypothetical protein